MSRKKKVILLVVSLLVIVIFLYHYGFFSRYNYIAAKLDIQRGNVQLISLDAEADSYFPVKSLSRKHKVMIDRCEPVFLINNITDKGVDIYNQQMERQIKLNLGEKRYRKYQNALDSLYKKLAKPLSEIEYPKNP